MKCRQCEHGKRYMMGSWYCLMYGMIIRDGYECSLGGAHEKQEENDDADRDRGGSDPGREHGPSRETDVERGVSDV